MRRIVSVLMTIAFVVSIAVIVARAAPAKKAFTSKAAVESVTPIVANVPAMTGYDVIQNFTQEPRDLSIAQNTFDETVTTARGRLSPTRAVDQFTVSPLARCRSGTRL